MIVFEKATSATHFKTIETLAHTIWNEHYVSIIGKPQVDYMLAKFQSANAICNQIKAGYLYYLLRTKTEAVGYISIKKEDASLFLSKLYILKSYRGRGFGKKAMTFVESKAKSLNCNSISLTVNKENNKSIKAYEALGFKNLGAIVIDIDNGFIMDDYKMQKELA